MPDYDPNGVARLRGYKARVPAELTANHFLLDFLIKRAEDGPLPNADALLRSIDQQITVLSAAHVEYVIGSLD